MEFGQCEFCLIKGITSLLNPGPSDGRLFSLLSQKWEARIMESYAELFRNACLSLGLSTNALTFETFQGVVVSPDDLSVLPGDPV